MAYTPVLIDGFEHGVLDTAGNGIAETISGAASISTTTVRSGSRSLRINPSAGQARYEYAAFTPDSLFEGHLAIRFTSFPDATVTFFELMDQASGDQRAQMVWASGINAFLIGNAANWLETPALSTGIWYLIEFAFDSSTANWTTKARVRTNTGGVFYDNQRTDNPIGASKTYKDMILGGLNNVTADYFIDDFVLATGSITEHPVDSVDIVAAVPNGVGTHSFDAATSAFFFKDIATTETALTTSETTSHEVIDDVPIDADADHILVRAASGVFPTIPTVAGSRILFTLNTAGGATKTFPNLSSLTKNAGDLLIAICIEYDGNSTDAEFSSWGGGFTEFADRAGTATMAIGCAYKISTGSETGTFTVTTADTSTNDSCMILMSIPGAHASTAPEASPMATGTAPDVGSFNPSGWDNEETLWIAVGASGETGTGGSYDGIATAPTNYTGQADSGISADAIGGVEGSVAFRQLAAASEDPGAWSMDTSNARGAALLIAVRPAVTTSQPTNTWYTEHAFGNSPSLPLWVRAIVNLSQDSALAADITAKLREGTNEENIYTGAIGSTSSLYKSKVFTQRPNAGGTWSQSAFDALVIRWGYTADADGTPRLRAIMLEGAYAHAFVEPVTPGGGTAAGSTPAPQVVVGTGGATATGTAPTSNAPVTPGGALGAGTAPGVVATVSLGGATAGGVAPTESSGTFETPAFGGATAQGVTPSPTSAVSAAGATAQGASPVSTTSATAAGATAQGSAPTANAVPAAAGAVAQGQAPGAGVPPSPGGVGGSGVGAAALITLTAQGALAGGVAPTEDSAITETPTFGGATASGNAPIALATAVAQGATGSGNAATGTATVSPGGATSSGTAAAAVIVLTSGGATSGGTAPSAPLTETPAFGGAIAGGAGPAATAVSGQGGSTASSFAVSPTIIVASGGATAGGNVPSVPLFETPTFGGAVAGGAGPASASVAGQGGSSIGDFTASPTITISLGGATTGGNEPTAPLAETPPPGSAIAGGFPPLEVGLTQYGFALGGDRSRAGVRGGDFARGGARGGDRARQYATGGDRRS